MLFNIFNKKKKGNDNNLNAFNLDEIEEFNRINKEKITKLNKSVINVLEEEKEVLSNENINNNEINESIIDESIKAITPSKEIKNIKSYINLSNEEEDEITNFLNNIDINILNEDIEKGIDLSNHNYTISYCDDAYKFIGELRDKYNIVLKYLIGFNNEKNGICNKTIFADKIQEEWRYLANYIKLLEKIKSIKK